MPNCKIEVLPFSGSRARLAEITAPPITCIKPYNEPAYPAISPYGAKAIANRLGHINVTPKKRTVTGSITAIVLRPMICLPSNIRIPESRTMLQPKRSILLIPNFFTYLPFSQAARPQDVAPQKKLSQRK